MTTTVHGLTFGISGRSSSSGSAATAPSCFPKATACSQETPIVVVLALLVIAKLLSVELAKISGVSIAARDRFDIRQRIVKGIALSVKFSTSIVLITIMFHEGRIDDALYAALITSKIGFKFVVPVLLAGIIPRWNIETAP